LLEASAALHHHLCPRQVLGVRIGLLAGETLAVLIPQTDKRLLTIVETDGCVTDGIAVATNCWVGRRTMRIEDYGKVAATFVDCRTDRAIRIAPRPEARQLAPHYAPDAASKWQAYLLGYQRMPASELLTWHAVKLVTPVQRLLSRPDVRAVCQTCGEEIINERQVLGATGVQCRACARGGYYVVGE
jgi:formylmethanofuran dehydrogenase subunit E